jgi:hypothetical protein
MLRRLYTRFLLFVAGDKVRDSLQADPCLFNARHYLAKGDEQQLAVMAIHYNTMTNKRAALTPDDVRALLAL